MKELEEKLKRTEQELNLLKRKSSVNYLGYEVTDYYCNNNELQNNNNNVLNLYKQMLLNCIPVEFRKYEKKFIKLNELKSFEEILKKIKENEIILREVNNLQPSRDYVTSLPPRLFMFLDHIKSITEKMNEFLIGVRKL